ncbi:MAG: hypothetical protein EA390_05090 [Balneolaceae bacterium]|nr:MAG: hypothetical protein EA390_05090 [Balneolaceae bacterium]
MIKKASLSILTVLIILGMIFWWQSGRVVTYGPGIMAPNEPVQLNLNAAEVFDFENYRLTPLADFEVHARVLSSKRYKRGREADLSPVDLALGWGRMSDETVIDQIHIRQLNRFYLWRVKQFPIPQREIETHSANMHMVPANDQIKRELKRVRKGDLVSFSGKLVRIDAPDGWRWTSSLTRTDTGNGACELVYVKGFKITTPE